MQNVDSLLKSTQRGLIDKHSEILCHFEAIGKISKRY